MAKLETIHGNGNYFLFHLLNFLFDLRNSLLGLSLGTIYRICQNYQIQFYQFPNKNLRNEIKRWGGQWQRTQSLATFINHLSINFSLFRSYSELTRKDLEWSIFKLKSFNTNRVDLKTFTKIVSLKEPLVVAQLLPNQRSAVLIQQLANLIYNQFK